MNNDNHVHEMAELSLNSTSLIAQPIDLNSPVGPINPPSGPFPPPNPPNWPPFPPFPEPVPPIRPFECKTDLKAGCYQITMVTRTNIPLRCPRTTYQLGTLRVEKNLSQITISGDTYRYLQAKNCFAPKVLQQMKPKRIPIFPRDTYYSYWKIVDIVMPPRFSVKKQNCAIKLTIEEYVYQPPSEIGVAGSFPQRPTRTFQMELVAQRPPSGFTGSSFKGILTSPFANVSHEISLNWVSDFYRKATLEIDTTEDVAAPVSENGEGFETAFKAAGWDLSVIYNDKNLNLPQNVKNTGVWTRADLHQFMLDNRKANTNLDKEWRFHLLSVSEDFERGGLFGIMYDDIDIPREGAVSFRDNLTGDFSSNAAYLRSAIHEVGHGFNLQHPPVDGLPNENFIMTQSGATRNTIENNGGSFPEDINFNFSNHNQSHLIHFPDVVVRPGGDLFGFGHFEGFAPQSEPEFVNPFLRLQVTPTSDRIKLGEPLRYKLKLENISNMVCDVPKNINHIFEETHIDVIRPDGTTKSYPSFTIACDSSQIATLKPKQTMDDEGVMFWASNGFAFEIPGKHVIKVKIAWKQEEEIQFVEASAEVWVDYPISDKDNEIAAMLLHPSVGKVVALGGQTPNLYDGVEKVQTAMKVAKNHAATKSIQRIANLA